MQHNEFLSAHVKDEYPLSASKAAFLTRLTSDEIQVIEDLTFWNAAFGKLLLDMGVDLDDEMPSFVTDENLSLIKEIVVAYKESPLKNKIIYWNNVQDRSSKEFRRYDQLFTKLYEQLGIMYPKLAAAIRANIHEKYYSDRTESSAGYHFETAANQRFLGEVILKLDPTDDAFASKLSEATRRFREQGHTIYHADPAPDAISVRLGRDFKQALSQLPISDESRKYLEYKLYDFYRTDKRTVRHIIRTITTMAAEDEEKKRNLMDLDYDDFRFLPKPKIAAFS